MTCTVRKIANASKLDANWNNPAWGDAESVVINHFRPESSPHRPKTRARLLYDEQGIHGIFQVDDCYVLCKRTEYGSEVWKDGCVEFFAQPKPHAGYLNFEFNCGGAFLCSHIVDPTRTPDGFKQFTRVPWTVAQRIKVEAVLPRVITTELREPLTWTLKFFVPFFVFEQYVGKLDHISGATWRGNFFKCAEENSHPHWAAWSPVDEFNFHLPRCFGEIHFA